MASMKADQERVRHLLTDTVSLLCKNGLTFQEELKIEGVIGVTLDNNEVFIVHVNEAFNGDGSKKSQDIGPEERSTNATRLEELPGLTLDEITGRASLHNSFGSKHNLQRGGFRRGVKRHAQLSRRKVPPTATSTEDLAPVTVELDAENEHTENTCSVTNGKVKLEPQSPAASKGNSQNAIETENIDTITLDDMSQGNLTLFDPLNENANDDSGEPPAKRKQSEANPSSQSALTSLVSTEANDNDGGVAINIEPNDPVHGIWNTPPHGNIPTESHLKQEPPLTDIDDSLIESGATAISVSSDWSDALTSGMTNPNDGSQSVTPSSTTPQKQTTDSMIGTITPLEHPVALYYDQTTRQDNRVCVVCKIGYPTLQKLKAHMKDDHDSQPRAETPIGEVPVTPVVLDTSSAPHIANRASSLGRPTPTRDTLVSSADPQASVPTGAAAAVNTASSNAHTPGSEEDANVTDTATSGALTTSMNAPIATSHTDAAPSVAHDAPTITRSDAAASVFETAPSLSTSRASVLTEKLEQPDASSEVICTMCYKAFADDTLLKSHMSIHNKDSRFHCQLCNKSFANKNHHTQHMVIHSGIRPHACPRCSKTFTRKADVKRHMKSKACKNFGRYSV